MTRNRSTTVGLGALALGLFLTTGLHGAETFLRTTHFTFNSPVAVPGAELAAGTYVFERVSISEPDVIVVRSQDRSKVYFLGFTERIDRPRSLNLNAPAVTLGEARSGAPVPIMAWYPIGETRGHRFIYAAR